MIKKYKYHSNLKLGIKMYMFINQEGLVSEIGPFESS
jgi:hypothetical protein